ncbi:MAG: hypothetical protein O3A47_05450 [Chloroflexi bacterium]|nr:hypothetical protein [Chloroflexota bacterium]
MTVRTALPTIDRILNQPVLPEVISFRCDDIEETVRTLQEKGVVFGSPVQDRDSGIVTTFELPGGVEVLLYGPKHPQA